MRNFIAVAVLLLVSSFGVQAQDNDAPFEVFGGYQFTRFNAGNNLDGTNLNGFNLGFQYNTSETFGIAGEFGFGRKSDSADIPIPGFPSIEAKTTFQTYLFGPRFRFKLEKEKVKPFVHALFGVARLGVEASGGPISVDDSDSTFGMALGGGIDYRMNDNFSLRAIDFDYLRTGFGDEGQNNIRLGVGVVVHFGSR